MVHVMLILARTSAAINYEPKLFCLKGMVKNNS